MQVFDGILGLEDLCLHFLLLLQGLEHCCGEFLGQLR